MSDSELMLDNTYASRIEGLFYSKSDEKFTVRALLDEVFGNAHFDNALDVGPGPGHITEPLALRTRNLTLVERQAHYEPILRKQFPNAKVIISDFEGAGLHGPYNAILLSHVLYYQPVESWSGLCAKLIELLAEKGELYVILNSDAGDWWKIVHHYSPKLAGHMAFHYKPLSQFKRELASIAQVHSHPYRFQVWIEPGATWPEFIGKQMLEIKDDAVLEAYDADFAQFVKQFKQVDGSVVMDFRAELVRLRRL